MTPQAGKQFGHYVIHSQIGAGGMGEVFLAEDTRLRRPVALKFLSAQYTADADRLARFNREAQAASALNHPNILTVYEIGAENEIYFIAAEFIDGEMLRDKLQNDKLTIEDALDIAAQTASALSIANEAGIVHRDIKPENIMIRRDGLVKVLDFGLAKLIETNNPEAETKALVKTKAGMIMGTAAYMSPEQARGKETDGRTDIWSFGCVLYEMLTGKQPFRGETMTDVLANIIHREPSSLLTLRRDAPAELVRIVNKSLCKNKDERYKAAKDLLADLKSLQKRLLVEAELESASSSNKLAEAQTQIIKAKTTANTETQNSIAVLPFSNLSNDVDNEYFCDGLAEELLNALSKIEDLKVAARTSAFSFKNKNVEISEIGTALNVKTILEGSVRKSGSKLRITVQLINAADGYHLWSERYDREMRDIFDVQDEITLAVVDALKVKLLGEEKADLL
ncbi:MAG TPA: protein kinase, partial [Pyrinomonadaceae bacterium]